MTPLLDIRSLRKSPSWYYLLMLSVVGIGIYFLVSSYIERQRGYAPPFNARKIDMPLDSSLFWDQKESSHGFMHVSSARTPSTTTAAPSIAGASDQMLQEKPVSSTSSRRGERLMNAPTAVEGIERSVAANADAVCRDFFALWPSDCVDKNEELHDKLSVLSSQMSVMNATLTLYATAEKMCNFNYPRVKVIIFNATQLLIDKGFSPAFEKMSTWNKSRYTRISDILRICLAHDNKMSYLDTDVHFLQLQARVYEQAYVGAAIWSNAKNAIEITNAAFCLPTEILSDMLSFQLNRILHGSDIYFYTELGPSMFHNVLLNRRAVTLYSQNHPAIPSLDRVASDIHLYAHKQLHLTGHVRKGNSELSFGQLVNKIRTKAGLPTLPLIPKSQSH